MFPRKGFMRTEIFKAGISKNKILLLLFLSEGMFNIMGGRRGKMRNFRENIFDPRWGKYFEIS